MRRYVYIARALFGVLNETVRRYVTHRRIRARVADPRPAGGWPGIVATRPVPILAEVHGHHRRDDDPLIPV